MAYSPTLWVDEETPLSAENMNHIELGIQDAAEAAEEAAEEAVIDASVIALYKELGLISAN